MVKLFTRERLSNTYNEFSCLQLELTFKNGLIGERSHGFYKRNLQAEGPRSKREHLLIAERERDGSSWESRRTLVGEKREKERESMRDGVCVCVCVCVCVWFGSC